MTEELSARETEQAVEFLQKLQARLGVIARYYDGSSSELEQKYADAHWRLAGMVEKLHHELDCYSDITGIVEGGAE